MVDPVATDEFKNFGQANAQYTGNGAAVGGNGNTDIFGVGSNHDQTIVHGRVNSVQEALEKFGHGQQQVISAPAYNPTTATSSEVAVL